MSLQNLIDNAAEEYRIQCERVSSRREYLAEAEDKMNDLNFALDALCEKTGLKPLPRKLGLRERLTDQEFIDAVSECYAAKIYKVRDIQHWFQEVKGLSRGPMYAQWRRLKNLIPGRPESESEIEPEPEIRLPYKD